MTTSVLPRSKMDDKSPQTSRSDVEDENIQLKQRIVELENALRRPTSVAVSGANNNLARDDAAFRFMDLPKETRLEIYELLLVRGKIPVRFSEEYAVGDPRYEGRSEEPAETQVLQISKAVRAEAVDIYLSKNMFVFSPINTHHVLADLPTGGYLARLRGWWSPGNPQPQLLRCLRSFSFAFDFRAGNNAEYAVRTWNERGNHRNGDTSEYVPDWWNTTEKARRDFLHQRARGYVCVDWESMCEGTSDLLNLRYLQLNVRNALCPFGCCRGVRMALDTMFNEDWKSPLEILEILGTQGECEVEEIREWVARNKYLSALQNLEVRFPDVVEADGGGDE